MSQIDRESLKPFAQRYVWWKTPDEAVAVPQRVIAQVMNLGDWHDVQALAMQVGESGLQDALAHAEAGQFNARSWAFWHYRLGMATIGHLPALPQRHYQ